MTVNLWSNLQDTNSSGSGKVLDQKSSRWDCSGSGKTNALLSLINHQLDIHKIIAYAKDLYESNYQYLMKKREQVGLKHPKDWKAFMEYSNDINEIYKCIEKYNAGKKQKVLIKFDNMIANIAIKKTSPNSHRVGY